MFTSLYKDKAMSDESSPSLSIEGLQIVSFSSAFHILADKIIAFWQVWLVRGDNNEYKHTKI